MGNGSALSHAALLLYTGTRTGRKGRAFQTFSLAQAAAKPAATSRVP